MESAVAALKQTSKTLSEASDRISKWGAAIAVLALIVSLVALVKG
jgi:hypothetical protein